LQLKDMASQSSENEKAVQAAEAKELALLAQQRELTAREKQLDQDVGIGRINTLPPWTHVHQTTAATVLSP